MFFNSGTLFFQVGQKTVTDAGIQKPLKKMIAAKIAPGNF